MGGGQSVKFLINQLVTSILEKEKKKKNWKGSKKQGTFVGGHYAADYFSRWFKGCFFLLSKGEVIVFKAVKIEHASRHNGYHLL